MPAQAKNMIPYGLGPRISAPPLPFSLDEHGSWAGQGGGEPPIPLQPGFDPGVPPALNPTGYSPPPQQTAYGGGALASSGTTQASPSGALSLGGLIPLGGGTWYDPINQIIRGGQRGILQ
jgi:hypothetical protein